MLPSVDLPLQPLLGCSPDKLFLKIFHVWQEVKIKTSRVHFEVDAGDIVTRVKQFTLSDDPAPGGKRRSVQRPDVNILKSCLIFQLLPQFQQVQSRYAAAVLKEYGNVDVATRPRLAARVRAVEVGGGDAIGSAKTLKCCRDRFYDLFIHFSYLIIPAAASWNYQREVPISSTDIFRQTPK